MRIGKLIGWWCYVAAEPSFTGAITKTHRKPYPTKQVSELYSFYCSFSFCVCHFSSDPVNIEFTFLSILNKYDLFFFSISHRVLKVELETYKIRVKVLQEENRSLKQASVIIVSVAN